MKRESNSRTAEAGLSPESSSDTVSGEFEAKSGNVIRIEDDRWRLSKDITAYLGPTVERLDPDVANGFRLALAFYAQNNSPDHTKNMADALGNYVRSTGEGRLTVTSLTNYRASLSKANEHRLGDLKGFLRTWFDLGYPGVDRDIIDTLNAWRLRGNAKGDAVKSLDPKIGPLDDVELEALNTTAAQLYEGGKINVGELAQLMLLTHLGSRAIQISGLKIKDLVLAKDNEDDFSYIVNLPLAKKRGAETVFRSSLKPKKVNKDLWQVLQQQAREVTDWVSEKVRPLTSRAVSELPLFPSTAAWPTEDECRSEDDLLDRLRRDQLHIRTRTIIRTLKRVVRLGDVRGRDGDLLNISPRRLRYTTGSRAAREGHGKWIIANLLDHTDTQSAGIYVDNHPNFTKVIDKAMSQALAPLAQAFMGTLVTSKAEARLADDPRQEISDGSNDVGVCGSHGYCGALAPIACYTCIHFQPLQEAPHGEILERLLEERERVKEYTGSEDGVVVGATDRTILAVTQVMRLCEERHSEETKAFGERSRE